MEDTDFGGLARDLDRKRVKAVAATVAAFTQMPDLLAERKASHGEYRDDARCAMRLIDVLLSELHQRRDRKQIELLPIQRHSLNMILHKVARIVAGDAMFADHWDDIQGYAKLVSDRLAPPLEQKLVHHEPPINGAEVLGLNKSPCHCGDDKNCMVDAGIAPKYVYCKRAEDADRIASPYARDGRPGKRYDDV